MIDRYGMAIRPPAFLSEDVAKSVFRPPWATLHAVARARGALPAEVFAEIEPDVTELAQALQSGLAAYGWPESDAARRTLIQRTIDAGLGSLRNQMGVLGDFAIAARGKSLAWLYGPDAMTVLGRMLGRRGLRVNRVALSLYCQDHEGHDVIGAIIRKIDRPDLVTGSDGESDAAAPSTEAALAPVVSLPLPKVPFAPEAARWGGAGPAPAVARAPITLPRANQWAEVSVAPPPSVREDSSGMVALFLMAAVIGGALRS